MIRPLVQALLCLAVVASTAAAEPVRDLIIRDVYILGSTEEAIDTRVNIRVVSGSLELVSEDEIESEEGGARVYDADGGFLLGRLGAGEPATFMILSRNPREDLGVLLNTRPYVRFAIEDGEIILNRLRGVRGTGYGGSEPGRRPRWLSYQPPPFAIPSSYEASRKWNTFQTRPVNGMFISALALDRQWISQDADSREQFGDLNEYERGTIRGWRFGLAGTLNFESPWIYNIAWAWNSFDRGFDHVDDELQFFDFSLDIPASRRVTVSVGKQKEPINMDRSMTMIEIPSQERYAAADAMFPTRNVGVVVSGTLLEQRMSWAGGVFNDWLVEGERFDDSATQFVGRVTALPVFDEDESNLVHVGFGVRYTNARQGLAYGSRPELGNAPRFVDTDTFAANSSTLLNYELGWRFGRAWLMAEFSDNHVDAPDAGDPRFTGFHLSGTWTLSGEMRPYMQGGGVFRGIGVAQDVHQGGWGAWEIGLRYSRIDLTDSGIKGGELDVATGQVAWWLTKSFAVSFNARRTWTERFGVTGTMDAVVGRVILILQ